MEGKRKMKKQGVSAILLAGVMLLGLTGCGDSKAKSYSKYVELGEYKGIKYTKTVEEVTDEQVEERTTAFRSSLAEEKEITDRAVEDGDIVNIDYVGTMDGEAFEGGTAEGQKLTIGSGQYIDGFESGLIGHNIGETVELNLNFPDPYPNNQDIAGKPVTFTVTINSITVKEKPVLTDELVKENSEFDSVKAYKDSLRKDMEAENELKAESIAESDLFMAAVNACKITGYDEKEVQEVIDEQFKKFKEQAESYKAYGLTYEDVLAQAGFETEEDLKEGLAEFAKNYLNQKMVLYCIADKEGIKVTSKDTDKMVKDVMEMYGIETEEEVYEFYGEEYFEMAVLTEKVMDMLKDNAVLVDSLEETTEETTEGTTKEAK